MIVRAPVPFPCIISYVSFNRITEKNINFRVGRHCQIFNLKKKTSERREWWKRKCVYQNESSETSANTAVTWPSLWIRVKKILPMFCSHSWRRVCCVVQIKTGWRAEGCLRSSRFKPSTWAVSRFLFCVYFIRIFIIFWSFVTLQVMWVKDLSA